MLALICVVGFFAFIYSAILFNVISAVCSKVPGRWRSAAVVVCILLGLVPAGFALRHFILRPIAEISRQASPFRPHMTEYVSLAARPGMVPSLQHPSGKIVLVNLSEEQLDGTFFDLPSDIRATSPSEVGTVALLSYRREQVGTYGNLGRAFQLYCDMSVYDKLTGDLIDQEHFIGGAPPPRSENGVDEDGARPSE